jgi:ABC-type polysaccharide/polyol phosphate export permease
MNLGLALLFSTATVFFKDMSQVLNYIVRLLIYATPVVYPVSSLSPSMRKLLVWNPFFPLFSAFQSIVTGTMPAASQLLQCLVWSAVLLTSGVWVFLRHERSFALHI